MSENLNTEIMTMAAESLWSNGVCERHNAVIGDMVTEIVVETKSPLEIALTWAVMQKPLCTMYMVTHQTNWSLVGIRIYLQS